MIIHSLVMIQSWLCAWYLEYILCAQFINVLPAAYEYIPTCYGTNTSRFSFPILTVSCNTAIELCKWIKLGKSCTMGVSSFDSTAVWLRICQAGDEVRVNDKSKSF